MVFYCSGSYIFLSVLQIVLVDNKSGFSLVDLLYSCPQMQSE